MSAFEIITPDNSQYIMLNDNEGRVPMESWIIGNSAVSVGWAVMSFARKHRIRLRDVGYAVRPVAAGGEAIHIEEV